jgi:hypothetical protein
MAIAGVMQGSALALPLEPSPVAPPPAPAHWPKLPFTRLT